MDTYETLTGLSPRDYIAQPPKAPIINYPLRDFSKNENIIGFSIGSFEWHHIHTFPQTSTNGQAQQPNNDDNDETVEADIQILAVPHFSKVLPQTKQISIPIPQNFPQSEMPQMKAQPPKLNKLLLVPSSTSGAPNWNTNLVNVPPPDTKQNVDIPKLDYTLLGIYFGEKHAILHVIEEEQGKEYLIMKDNNKEYTNPDAAVMSKFEPFIWEIAPGCLNNEEVVFSAQESAHFAAIEFKELQALTEPSPVPGALLQPVPTVVQNQQGQQSQQSIVLNTPRQQISPSSNSNPPNATPGSSSSTIDSRNSRNRVVYDEIFAQKNKNLLQENRFGFGNFAAQQWGLATNTKKVMKSPKIRQIVTQAASNFVLMENGDLYSFGLNYNGQLGVGDASKKIQTIFKPQKITAFDNLLAKNVGCYPGLDIPIPEKIEQVFSSTFANHAFALTNLNRVFGWGYNFWYQIGTGDDKNQNTPVNINIPQYRHENPNSTVIPGIVKKIACGLRHTLILFHDGSIFCSGSNFYGQLGFSKDIREKAKFAPINFFCHFTDATSNDGSSSQSTQNPDENMQNMHIIHHNYIVKDIVCGGLFSLVLTKENFLYGFGDNLKKQLVDLDKEKIYTPTLISFDFLFNSPILNLPLNTNPNEQNKPVATTVQKSVKQMVAGRYYIAVLDSNNELYWRGEIDKDNTTEGPKGFLNEKRLETLNVLRPELGNDVFLHPGYESLFVQLLPKSGYELEIKKGMLQFVFYMKLTESSIWGENSTPKKPNQSPQVFYCFEDVELIAVDRKMDYGNLSGNLNNNSNLTTPGAFLLQNAFANQTNTGISTGIPSTPANQAAAAAVLNPLLASITSNLKKRSINQLLTIPQINMNAISGTSTAGNVPTNSGNAKPADGSAPNTGMTVPNAATQNVDENLENSAKKRKIM